MGVAERREREREQLRDQIVIAARDLLIEQGLSGLSMRSIAERIEYSPATIYLYFRDKNELVREVVATGFELMEEVAADELKQLPAAADPAEQYAALGRAYARFALENPAYFRVMFELPATPELCDSEESGRPDAADVGFERTVGVVRRAMEQGRIRDRDPRRQALIGWGLIHGLTTLYLSGHLGAEVSSPEEFRTLVEEAMESIHEGWRPGGSGGGEE